MDAWLPLLLVITNVFVTGALLENLPEGMYVFLLHLERILLVSSFHLFQPFLAFLMLSWRLVKLFTRHLIIIFMKCFLRLTPLKTVVSICMSYFHIVSQELYKAATLLHLLIFLINKFLIILYSIIYLSLLTVNNFCILVKTCLLIHFYDKVNVILFYKLWCFG